jgi:hypothetical protein
VAAAPAGPGVARVQHPRRVPPAAGGRARAGTRAGRTGAPARVAAHHLSRGGRRRRAARGTVRRLHPPRGGAVRGGHGRARSGDGAAGGGRGGPPVRPDGRPALSPAAAAAGRGRRAAAEPAPRHRRRVEPGGDAARTVRAVRRVPGGRTVTAARAGAAVRRLRGVAARADGRRRAGPAAGLVARAAGRRPRAAGTAGGPPAPGRADVPRRPRLRGPFRRSARAAARPGPRGRRHAVHGAAGRLSVAPGPLRRGRRRGGGHTCVRPRPPGSGGDGRLLRQHGGAADGAGRRSRLS